MALLFFLPKGTWLSSEVWNCFVIIHWPVLHLLRGADDWFSGVIVLLFCLFLMGLFWGFIIYWLSRLRARLEVRFIVSKKQKLFVGYGFAVVGVFVLGAAIVSALPQTPRHFETSPEIKSTVDGNTAFAFDLYQKLKEQPGNLFFSPYSISSCLSMTYAGARNETEKEIANTLHFRLPQEKLHHAFGALTKRLHEIERWHRITLTTANALFCQSDYQFKDVFLNLIRTNYAAEARPVDFKHSPHVVASEINRWVQRKTNGKIRDLVDAGKFTQNTKLVLCNAIYFKGKWQKQFKPSDTKPAPFNISTTQTVTVPMMYQHAEFKTTSVEDDTFDLLELPYIGRDLSMIILLPSRHYLPGVEENNLAAVEQKLTSKNIQGWFAKLDSSTPQKIHVGLPRFTTTQVFDLASVLKFLGMPLAFNDDANFSGIDGTTNLFISDVIHQAFVEVNEAGTEAAAGTFATAKTKSQSQSFIVNRPFIFLIRDNGSGSILFLGRIIDPTK